eukprot:scaffold585448_cov50-Prasinocladus_malaysianus.AAC.1
MHQAGSSIVTAVSRGDATMVEKLLDSGASANSFNKAQALPFTQHACVMSLVDLSELSSPFQYCSGPHLTLHRKASTQAKLNDGLSLLAIAMEKGDLDIVKMLLENDADTEAENRHGKRPLHVAAEEGHEELVKELLDAGADPAAKSRNGYTPLQMAARSSENIGAMHMLLNKRVE